MTVPETATSQAVPAARRPGRAAVWLARLGPLIGLAFVLTFFSVLRPSSFPTLQTAELILTQTAVVGTAAMGMTIIIVAGGIDLSVGANIALVTVVIAMLLNAGAPPLLAAAGGVGAALVVGLLIGLLVTQARLAPFIVTLGFWGGVRGVAKQLSGGTVLPCPDSWLDTLLRFLSAGQSWMIVPPGVWLMLLSALAVSLTLRYTRFGRHVFAIGSNEQTARLCGVRVNWTKILVYLAGTLLAGLAGILEFSHLTVGDPTTANGMELSIIAAVVIGGGSLNGGQGSAAGSILGALIMTAVANGCSQMGLSNSVQDIVTGALIILAVFLDKIRHRRSA